MKENRTVTSSDTPAAEPRTPNVSVYTSTNAPDFRKRGANSPFAQARRRTRRFHQTPVTTLPEDDGLDEVMEALDQTPMFEEVPIDESELLPVNDEKTLSLFHRTRTTKAKRGETASAAEIIRAKSGFSEADVDMLFELGYGGELGRLVGHENLKVLRQDHNMRIGKSNRRHYRTSFGYCGLEDVNPRTESSVLATYAHHKRKLLWRTLLTFLFTAILFLIECPMILGGGYEAFVTAHPLVFKISSLVLLAVCCIFSRRQVISGIRSYFRLTPTPYSSVGLLLPFALIYDVAAFFTTDFMLPVNALISALLLLLAVCDVMRLVCELRTVHLLCTEGAKTVLEPTEPRKRKLRHGKKLVKIINDDIDESFYRVQKAEETAGFFRRFNDFSATSGLFHLLLGIPPAVAFVCAFIALLLTRDPSVALSLFMTVLITSSPFCGIFTFFYPLCRANRLLSKVGCALIGEEAVIEYGESKTVIFSDTELYSAEQCTEISVREGDDFKQDLRTAAILFCKMGGTLASVGNAYGGKGLDAAVTFRGIGDNGVEAIVDGVTVLAGTLDFMRANHIRIPRESSDKALRRTQDVGVIYVAIEGVLKLSYEVEYKTRWAFEDIVEDLANINVGVAIESYDPNLNEAFLKLNRGEDSIPIRVCKPSKHEVNTTLRVSDTGAVALGDEKDILCTLYAADGIHYARNFGTALQYVLSILGMIGATVLSCTVLREYITPLTLAAYHLSAILVTLAVSQFHLNNRAFKIKKKNK